VHVQAFAREMGTTITVAEVAEFLNRAGVAQSLWIQMIRRANSTSSPT
jgi:hypothetical protein